MKTCYVVILLERMNDINVSLTLCAVCTTQRCIFNSMYVYTYRTVPKVMRILYKLTGISGYILYRDPNHYCMLQVCVH